MKNINEFDMKLFETLSKCTNRVFFYYASANESMSKWSPSAVEYFGLESEYIPFEKWFEKIHPDDQDEYQRNYYDLIVGKTPYHNCEYRITNAECEYVWVNCRGYMNYDDNGLPEFFAGYVTNLGVIPKVDVVTGLWTGYGLRNDITKRLDLNISGAVMQIDIGNFNRINARFGYDFGDLVMYTLGKKISAINPKAMVYRLEGPEFVVMLDGGREEIHTMYKALKRTISQISINDTLLNIDFWVGATLFPEDGKFVDQVQNNLSYAISAAKHIGSDEVVFYNKDLFEKRNRVIRMTESLRNSIDNDFEGFKVVLQPIIDEKTGTAYSAEALLRWSSPEFDRVGPMDFVPILEETKGIIPVGKWVIDQTFSYVSRWNKQKPNHQLKHININFSYIQFTDPTLKDYIIEKLDEYNLPHNTLVAELTESCRVEYSEKLAELLQEYRDEGIIIALDDFGTGYASLSVLRDIPTDIVKLDRDMTKSVSSREKDRNLIEFIISYCRKMNIDVCTEGIETDETRNIVRDAGTTYIQGYYYDKPLEVNEFFKKYIY